MQKCSKEFGLNVRVRQATREDIPAMLEIEQEIPTSANWSREHYESLFRTQSTDPSSYLVLVIEDASRSSSQAEPVLPAILGFLAAHCVDQDWELQYIAVAKSWQRRGLATQLLQELVQQARVQKANAIFLEVRESNQGARALYRRAGFLETGVRKAYYANPVENGVLLRMMLP